MIITLPYETLRAAYEFRAKRDTRVYLQYLALQSFNRLDCTDGHTAFMGTVQVPDDLTETLLFLPDATPKKCEYVELNTETQRLTGYAKGAQAWQSGYSVPTEQWRYPSIERVINHEPAPVGEIGFDPKYLARLAVAFPQGCCKFTFHGASQVAVVTSIKHPDHRVAIMPLRA